MNKNDDIVPKVDFVLRNPEKPLFDIVARVDNIFPSGLPKDFLNKPIIEGEIITGILPEYIPVNYDFPLDGNYTESITHQEGKIWNSYDS